MKKCFVNNFFLCGFCGWCAECLWTGLGSMLKHRDRTLSCHTSIWMFPIYGMGACLTPICSKLKGKNILCRGGVYTVIIYLAELITGITLKKFKACPWDYSKARHHYKGVIRLDYVPVWFIGGLLLERLLSRE